jgi:hypothetical protein
VIGGTDVLLLAPPGVPAAEIILATMRLLWPGAIFQDANATQGHEIADRWTSLNASASTEFFIFRDRGTFEKWQQEGASSENENSMLHFLLDQADAKANSLVHVTLVCDTLTSEIEKVVGDLQLTFGN